MGAVWRAEERATGRPVAAKVFHASGPEALQELKREFRVCRDLVHPNLVGLRELHVQGSVGLFTMELVDGVPFVAALRPSPRFRSTARTTLAWHHTAEEPPERPPEPPASDPRPLAADGLARLRHLLRQLLEALRTLHGTGIVHQDVKPENVLVTPDDRVVLLDFGLASLRHEGPADEIVGTIGYLAPERLTGAAPTPAADAFAVGVLLYEALVGRPPTQGPLHDQLRQLFGGEVVAPAEALDDVPEALSELAMTLLSPDPDARGTLDEALVALDTGRVEAPGAPPLLGRDEEIDALLDHLTARDARRICLLRGPSGHGKSRLLDALVERIAPDEGHLVLRSRCSAVEYVPFQGLDPLVDGLAQWLRSWSGDETPPPSAPLCGVFPVFGPPSTPVAATAEERLRAIDDLARLFRFAAERTRLVWILDDAQWLDGDSSWAIARLLRGSRIEARIVFAYRPDASFEARVREIEAPAREIALGELDASLVRAWWAQHARDGGDPIAGLTATTDHLPPFVVASLTTWLPRARPDEAGPGVLGWQSALRHAVDRLAPAAQDVVVFVCLAATDLRWEEAAGLVDGAAAPDAILRGAVASRLLHIERDFSTRALRPVHDRIRQGILEHLGADPVRHRRLAQVFAGRAAAEALVAHHYIAAGDEAAAVEPLARAAARAMEQSAFERAAGLYRQALACSGDRARFGVPLAEALAAHGRLADAAETLLRTAPNLPDRDRDRVRARAADLLIGAGMLDRGEAVLGELLREVGVSMPTSTATEFGRLAWWSVRGRLPRAGASTSPARLDALYVAGACLGVFEPVRSASLHAQHRAEATWSDDLAHQLRGRALDYCFALGQGAPPRRIRQLDEAIQGLVPAVDDPAVGAFVDAARGYGAFLACDWRGARHHLDRALEAYGDGRAGLWEQRFSEAARLAIDAMAVGPAALGQRADALREVAMARGDVTSRLQIDLSVGHLVRLLRDDDPEAARQALDEACEAWPRDLPHDLRFRNHIARTQFDLYEGDVDAAWRRWRAPPEEARHLQSFRFVRMSVAWWGGVAGVAGGASDRAIDRRVRTLRSLDALTPDALAHVLEGLRHRRAGASSLAREAFRRSLDGFHMEGHELLAAAAQALVEEDLTPIATLGAQDPAATLRALTGVDPAGLGHSGLSSPG